MAEYTSDYSKITDNISNDSSISDRINTIGSEDELSTGMFLYIIKNIQNKNKMFIGSGNHSPRLGRRSNKHNSVNYHSPRSSANGEAKLRPGVTSRSANRNSANLTSSNFKEELLRLINPDNIESSSSSSSPSAEPKDPTKNHSRFHLLV